MCMPIAILHLFFYENGDSEACEEAIQTILTVNPEDPEDIHKIAVTLCELKEHDKATDIYEEITPV